MFISFNKLRNKTTFFCEKLYMMLAVCLISIAHIKLDESIEYSQKIGILALNGAAF